MWRDKVFNSLALEDPSELNKEIGKSRKKNKKSLKHCRINFVVVFFFCEKLVDAIAIRLEQWPPGI